MLKMLFTLFIFCLPLVLLINSDLFACLQNNLEKSRIIIGSGVNLRDAPQLTGKEITKIPLGTIVKELETSAKKTKINQKEDYWYRIVLPDGKEGWVFGGLTSSFDSNKRGEAYLEILKARVLSVEDINNKENNDANFDEQADLLRFVTQALTEIKEPEILGELELAQLLALRNAVILIPYDKENNPKYKKFTFTHKDKLNYVDYGDAGWKLKTEELWNLEKKYSGQPIADKIAWEAANNPLGGECEGDIYCELIIYLRGTGEYLQKYPSGIYAKEAIQDIGNYVMFSIAEAKENKEFLTNYDAKTKADIREDLKKLQNIVIAAKPLEKDALAKQIEEFIKLIK